MERERIVNALLSFQLVGDGCLGLAQYAALEAEAPPKQLISGQFSRVTQHSRGHDDFRTPLASIRPPPLER